MYIMESLNISYKAVYLPNIICVCVGGGCIYKYIMHHKNICKYYIPDLPPVVPLKFPDHGPPVQPPGSCTLHPVSGL